ncbi:Ubiquinol oxidase 2, mitochondrial [Capsicum baccatum]|uniref:Ubiquinol oxidase n=1 Tax=Capsicum baccatum TaxID=33114 RepID=A0A2G2X4C4_CAPBA|nr:Ubiquinol oxidase 2, mitochondrial [Capsicum baccatum]
MSTSESRSSELLVIWKRSLYTYTLYLNDIDRGEIENVTAPAIAIDYWRLPKDATLKDVVTVIRADEAHHRDVLRHSLGVQLLSRHSRICRLDLAVGLGSGRDNFASPWETYQDDFSIDLSKHHVPKKFLDKVAYWLVKLLRIPTDLFFKERQGCRAMILETMASVPGMVGGMLLHLRSLRKFELLRQRIGVCIS